MWFLPKKASDTTRFENAEITSDDSSDHKDTDIHYTLVIINLGLVSTCLHLTRNKIMNSGIKSINISKRTESFYVRIQGLRSLVFKYPLTSRKQKNEMDHSVNFLAFIFSDKSYFSFKMYSFLVIFHKKFKKRQTWGGVVMLNHWMIGGSAAADSTVWESRGQPLTSTLSLLVLFILKRGAGWGGGDLLSNVIKIKDLSRIFYLSCANSAYLMISFKFSLLLQKGSVI